MLTTTRATKTKPRAKEFNLSCGKVAGLHLRIKPSGSKLWVFNYTRPATRKRTNIGLGKYPELTLAQARDKAADYRSQLANNIDPKLERDRLEKESELAHMNTFESIARAWLATKDISPTYAFKIKQGLENHVFKTLGNIPVHLIKAPDTIRELKPLEDRGALVTLGKICRWVNEVMNFAVNTGLTPVNPLTGIRVAFKRAKPVNMASLSPDQIPRLMKGIHGASISPTTRCLILWQLHTLTRPSEAAGTRWDEIDFVNKLWTIPAQRMKKAREHVIPLTPQTLSILGEMKNNREYVFPSAVAPTRPANSQSCNMALKRMGFKGELVSHGMRHLASTTLNEQRQFDSDVIEAALSHVDTNTIRATYNKSLYLEPRREMMLWWSAHLVTAA